jgi:hypothetical protein
MCCASIPALRRKRSAARCDTEPMPAEAKFMTPGLALAAVMRSATVLKPFDGAVTSTVGVLPSATTAAKSLSVS